MNHPLYKCDIIIDLIEQRWKESFRRVFLKDFTLFSIFLLIICLNTVWIFPYRLRSFDSEVIGKPNCNSKSSASIILDIVTILIILMIYARNEYREIKSVFIHNKKYGVLKKILTHYNTIWNVLDTYVILVGLIFCSMDLAFSCRRPSDQQEDVLKVFCSMFFFSSWLRLLDFARGFSKTSTLIRMLIRVIRDMIGFFAVLFFLIVGFALAGNKN